MLEDVGRCWKKTCCEHPTLTAPCSYVPTVKADKLPVRSEDPFFVLDFFWLYDMQHFHLRFPTVFGYVIFSFEISKAVKQI